MKNKKTKKHDIGILVSSCDEYADLWDPFFQCFQKHWSDCELPIYLMSNSKVFPNNIVKTLTTNHFKDWSSEMSQILDQYPHEYLLYIQDDYLFTGKVENVIINRLIDIMITYSAGYLRLYPHPGKRKSIQIYGNNEILELVKGSPFVTSLQISLWHTQTFKNLLVSGETIWDFEKYSPSRTIKLKRNLYSVPRIEEIANRVYAINYVCTAVRKGKWRKDAVEYCYQNNISIDLSQRFVETNWDIFKKEVIYDHTPEFFRQIMLRILW